MFRPKKMLIAIPVMIMTVFLISGIAYGASNKTGTINADSVNVRSTPETSSKVNFMLAKGTKVNIIEKSDDWYKISYNDADGWVFGQYIELTESQIGTGTVNASNVNVRSKADKDSEVITRFDKGHKVKIFEYSGEWARILIEEDRYGWISRDYVTVAKETVSRGLTSDVRNPVASEDEETEEDDSKVESTEDKEIREQVVAYAKKYIGVKYKYGGTTTKGFDCSGFVKYVFKHFDITLERTSADQGSHGTKIDREDLKPGDLVFFDTNGGNNAIEHVGIYIGSGKFIHASSGSSRCVTISSLNEGFYDKAYMRSRRYIKD